MDGRVRRPREIVQPLEKTSYLAHVGRSGEVQALSRHLLQVSAISARLAAKIGMERAGELIGLTHDLGKYSQAFQQYLQEQALNEAMAMEPDLFARGSVDHSTAGAQIVWYSLNNLSTSQARHAAEFLALCIASHHSGLIDCVKRFTLCSAVMRSSSSVGPYLSCAVINDEPPFSVVDEVQRN